MPNLRTKLFPIVCLFRRLFFPLDQSQRIHCQISCSLVNLIRCLDEVMPHRASVEYTLLKIFFIRKDYSILLDSHVSSICWHYLEEIEALLISFSFANHPLGCHKWGFMAVCLFAFLIAVLTAHCCRVNGQPAVNFWDDSDCLLFLNSWLLHDVKLIAYNQMSV